MGEKGAEEWCGFGMVGWWCRGEKGAEEWCGYVMVVQE